MRIAVILNERSGSLGDPEEFLRALGERTEIVSVHAPGEGAAAAATPGIDRLLVAGGDGTLGDAFAAAASAGLPLAVVPGGTANDFARALGLPDDRDAAIALATEPQVTTQPTWGGTVGGRPFVNVASVGLAVDAAERAEELKSKLGPAAYAAGALHAGLVGRAVRTILTVDGEETARGSVYQLLVGASGRFGGGSGLGEADPAHPQLVAAWVPATSRLELPLRAAGLRRRTIEQQPGVEWWRADRLTVEATVHHHPAPWNIDGERWHPPVGPVELERLGPVDVIVPGAAGH
ncbi:MAG: hypothetical protein J7513_17260 [Solirubrobacteraceae bacterium]|nr:hypothetical protein [Solirubrobacteraceae bacterium]